MFLNAVLERNPQLVETAFWLHQKGLIQPDTYILDLDTIASNGQHIKAEGDKHGIALYFMTKQLGRNPLVAKALMELGYSGAVAVDYREALTLAEAGIKVAHVGHLVQPPTHLIKKLLQMGPEVITVYSVEKAAAISAVAATLGITQPLMLRVTNEGDRLYPGQHGGFELAALGQSAEAISRLPNVTITGVTSFPCLTLDEETSTAVPTPNVATVLKAKALLEGLPGLTISQINIPSLSCTATMPLIAALGGTHAEPGHGLLGTTPLHAVSPQPEAPAIVYVSEISHRSGSTSYCFGGGHYRRSFMKNALVGSHLESAYRMEASAPSDENIDYYLSLLGQAEVGDTAVFSFRTQIFVTRSQVAVVEGLATGRPRLAGIYSHLGYPV